MKIEGAVVSEGDNPRVQHEDKSLDTTHDSSRLGNRIVEEKDEVPSRILNSTFNDGQFSSSERTPEALGLWGPIVIGWLIGGQLIPRVSRPS